jgi:hypothetical protein
MPLIANVSTSCSTRARGHVFSASGRSALFVGISVVSGQLKRGFDGVDKRGGFDGLGEGIRAPPLMARTDIGIVPWPVRVIGISPAVLEGVSTAPSPKWRAFAYRGSRTTADPQSGVAETLLPMKNRWRSGLQIQQPDHGLSDGVIVIYHIHNVFHSPPRC